MTAILNEMQIEAVVVDMQDVGVRLYTFIWTMYNLMQAVADANLKIKFLVCDRPNPISGNFITGPLLNLTCCASGYGRSPITHVHGMTIGELALYFNSPVDGVTAAGQGFIYPPIRDLQVLTMDGWRREMMWRDTGLPWVVPSPNIPTPGSAEAYVSTVFLEATSAAEGRGTTTPFQLFGAPFVNALVSLLRFIYFIFIFKT